jgi:hypothetical protein
VKFYNASSVQLGKNSVSENFISGSTSLTKEVKEVNLSELEPSTFPYQDNGTKVIFEVLPQGKRKPIKKEYYLLWE